MKKRSRSLTRSRKSNARCANAGADADRPGVGVDARKKRVRESEAGIELDRALEMRDGADPRHQTILIEGKRVGMQRVERPVVARGSATS